MNKANILFCGAALLMATLPGGLHAAPPADVTALAAKSPTIAQILKRDSLWAGSGFKYRTFNYKNAETGENEGFMVDVAKALAKRLLGDERKLQWQYAAGNMGNGNVMFLVRGEVDVMVDPVAPNPRFKKLVAFTDPIFMSGTALLAKRDSPIKSLADLKKGVRVIVDRGNAPALDVMAKYPEATYLVFEDSMEQFNALRNGEGDVVLHHYTHVYDMASQDDRYSVRGRFVDKPFSMECSKADPVFLQFLNDFIREFHASGEHARLLKKWFSTLDPDYANH